MSGLKEIRKAGRGVDCAWTTLPEEGFVQTSQGFRLRRSRHDANRLCGLRSSSQRKN